MFIYYTKTCSNPDSQGSWQINKKNSPNSGIVAEKLKATPINQLSQCNIVKSLFVLLRKGLRHNSLDTYTLNIQMHTKETQKAHIQPRGSFRTTHHFMPERKSCKPQLHYSLSKTRTTSVGPTVCQPDQQTWTHKPESFTRVNEIWRTGVFLGLSRIRTQMPKRAIPIP